MKLQLCLAPPFRTHLAADPTIVVDADGQVDAKKALKALSFPTMDDDGLPSSYTQKVLLALGKWRVKMRNIVDALQSLEERPENLDKLLSLFIKIVCFHCHHTTVQLSSFRNYNDYMIIAVELFNSWFI